MNNWIWLAVVAGACIAVVFNIVIGQKNRADFAYASIDAQLKKRCDLIPNLVAACEKYMGYEAGLLRELTLSRSRILHAADSEKMTTDAGLAAQLRSLFAVAENYPELRASASFTLLQRSLNEVEEQLAAARRAFNAAVTAYNNAIQMFPTNIAARLMGYRVRPWFEAGPDERLIVKVWR